VIGASNFAKTTLLSRGGRGYVGFQKDNFYLPRKRKKRKPKVPDVFTWAKEGRKGGAPSLHSEEFFII